MSRNIVSSDNVLIPFSEEQFPGNFFSEMFELYGQEDTFPVPLPSENIQLYLAFVAMKNAKKKVSNVESFVNVLRNSSYYLSSNYEEFLYNLFFSLFSLQEQEEILIRLNDLEKTREILKRVEFSSIKDSKYIASIWFQLKFNFTLEEITFPFIFIEDEEDIPRREEKEKAERFRNAFSFILNEDPELFLYIFETSTSLIGPGEVYLQSEKYSLICHIQSILVNDKIKVISIMYKTIDTGDKISLLYGENEISILWDIKSNDSLGRIQMLGMEGYLTGYEIETDTNLYPIFRTK